MKTKILLILLVVFSFIIGCQGKNNEDEIIDTHNPPTITATSKNITIYTNLAFDPLDYVVAYDEKKNDISNQIVVNTNNFDITKAGTYIINYSITDNSLTASISITFNVKELAKEIHIEINKKIRVEGTVPIEVTFSPTGSSGTVCYKWQSYDNLEDSIEVIDNIIYGKKVDYLLLTAYLLEDETIQTSIDIDVYSKDTTPSIFSSVGTEQTILLNSEFDPLEGIIARDAEDGIITGKVTYTGEIDTSVLGTYAFLYSITDSAENTSTLEVTIFVKESPIFVGHRGSYYGVESTYEAFLNGIEKGYTYLETDVKMTSDGVLVLCHDDTLERFGQSVIIANETYETLKALILTQTRGDTSYTGTIMTLSELLDLCKEKNVTPLIELKWTTGINTNDTSQMYRITNLLEEKEMTEKVVFLSSMKPCLEYLHNYNSNIKCQLLCALFLENNINYCATWGFDIDIEITYVTTSIITMCHEKGLKINIWTTNSLSTVKQYWTYGVDMITCDYFDPSTLK